MDERETQNWILRIHQPTEVLVDAFLVQVPRGEFKLQELSNLAWEFSTVAVSSWPSWLSLADASVQQIRGRDTVPLADLETLFATTSAVDMPNSDGFEALHVISLLRIALEIFSPRTFIYKDLIWFFDVFWIFLVLSLWMWDGELQLQNLAATLKSPNKFVNSVLESVETSFFLHASGMRSSSRPWSNGQRSWICSSQQ